MRKGWISGSTRRVIENIVDRLVAGEAYKEVMADYPTFVDEYGYQPDLSPIERLAKKKSLSPQSRGG